MESVKTGIVGCGKVAHIHAAALNNLSRSEFVAVCSRSKENGAIFGNKYGVESYTDVEEMISNSGVEAVIICTPHPAHAESTIKSLKSGAHVLVEKPLASSLSDCDSMIEASESANLKLGMVSQRRLYLPSQRIKKAIDDGKIGTPIIGTVNMFGWRDQNYYDSDQWRGTWDYEGGGVLVNQAPHQLDLLLWYMGEVEELFGYWSNFNHPYIEVEDTATAIVRFKNGGVGNIIVSNSQNPALYGKVAIYGSNGSSIGVQTDGGAMFIAGMSSIEEPPYNDLWTVNGEEEKVDIWKMEDEKFFNTIDPIQYYHELQIKDFLDAVINDKSLLVPGSEGRNTVELFNAIYRSQMTNEVIKFPLT